MKKMWLFLALIGIMACSLCGISSAEPITIQYITLGGAQMDIMNVMVSAFEKANPSIKVKVENWPLDDAYAKYVTRIKANDLPDCGYMFITNLKEFKERGALVPVGNYLTKKEKADYYKVLIKRTTLEDGKVWAIPAWFSTRLFMYRKDILDKKGIKVPETPDQLLSMVKKLHNPPEMYGFAFPGGSTRHIFRWFGIQLWGRGGDFFNKDMTKVTFNSKAGVEALTFLTKLKPYFQPGYLQQKEQDVERLFSQGKVPVTQMYYRVLTDAMDKNPGWKVTAEFAPTPKKVTLGIMDVFGVFKSTPAKQAAAVRWLQFIQKNEYSVPSNLKLGYQPVKQSMAQEFTASEDVKKYSGINNFINATPKANFEPLHPMWSQIESIIGRNIQECFLDKLTPKQALDKAAKETNEILND